MSNQEQFSLLDFERSCYNADPEKAVPLFFTLLKKLDVNFGAFDGTMELTPMVDREDLWSYDEHLVNRICSAISTLFANRSFGLSDTGAARLFVMHRWVSTLFGSSAFKNADHILRALFVDPKIHDGQLSVSSEQFVKFCIFFTANSELPLNIEAIWNFNPNLAIAFAAALVTPRFLGTRGAYNKRENLLNWMPDKLEQIESLEVLPLDVIHDLYMHCSYADLPRRHAIKAPLNRLIRKKLLRDGHTDVPNSKGRERSKPLMMVILEWFSAPHSIYRTHSKSILAAREFFTVIGLGLSDKVDEAGKAIFDEFIEIPLGDMISFVRNKANKLRPEIVYYPAFGMFPHSIFLTNLRLAPVQVVSYGHPATSMSPFIDYLVLPEDWVGDPDCFSEKLLPLPAEDMPFVPSSLRVTIEPNIRENPEVVHIAIASTIMKINPTFLGTLKKIQERADEMKRPIKFNFLMGFSNGLVFIEVRQFILSFLPEANIYSHAPYPEYMERMNKCDMYLNPFPFGNTNGIVDTTSIGLVGVNKTGPEVLEHIDEAMFHRMGLPEWLSAKTIDEYIDAACKLIADDELRVSLRRKLIAEQAEEIFYRGDGRGFGLAMLNLIDGNHTVEATANNPANKGDSPNAANITNLNSKNKIKNKKKKKK